MAIYDTHPVYPHQAHLYFAYEPWKSLYVFQRLLTTLLLVPIYVTYYALIPRRFRPRPSWALKQIVIVNFYRRIYKVTEVAGVTWGTRNPDEEADNATLKETRFEWIPKLPDDLQTGVLVDEEVPCKRVGVFRWPRDPPTYEKAGMVVHGDGHSSVEPKLTPDSTVSSPGQSSHGHGPDVEAEAGKMITIGIFMHGGGYTQMSAHEKAGTSRIPRRLVKDKILTEVYAVEYRLLQHAGCPGALQDAVTAYAHVVINRMGAVRGSDGVYRHPTDGPLSSPRRRRNVRVILIGDSAGGNLVLATARWIRDEGLLPPPDGLLLLSPSCDPSHAFPLTPSSYIPRPNASTDYLVDTPEPRALLQRTFLGHHPLETIHSPYISPASPRVLRAYGHPVTLPCGTIDGAHLGIGAIAEAGASAVAIAGPAVASSPAMAAVSGIGRQEHGAVPPSSNDSNEGLAPPRRPESSLGSSSGTNTPFTGSPNPNAYVFNPPSHDYTAVDDDVDLPAPQRPYAPTADNRVNSELVRATRLVEHGALPGGRPALQSTLTFLNPQPRKASLRGSLFGEFPRSFVTVGDAERLQLEITNLVRAMERDGVDLTVEWAKDAVHDMLMLAWWDEKVREQVWSAIRRWVESL